MDSALPATLQLGPQDNCVVLVRGVAQGETLLIGGAQVRMTRALGIGHKLACRAIAPGEQVLKYNAPIGRASAPIALGEHIHLHNLVSDYIPTWQQH